METVAIAVVLSLHRKAQLHLAAVCVNPRAGGTVVLPLQATKDETTSSRDLKMCTSSPWHRREVSGFLRKFRVIVCMKVTVGYGLDQCNVAMAAATVIAQEPLHCEESSGDKCSSEMMMEMAKETFEMHREGEHADTHLRACRQGCLMHCDYELDD